MRDGLYPSSSVDMSDTRKSQARCHLHVSSRRERVIKRKMLLRPMLEHYRSKWTESLPLFNQCVDAVLDIGIRGSAKIDRAPSERGPNSILP